MREKVYTTAAERDLEARRLFRNVDTASIAEWTEDWIAMQQKLSQLVDDEAPPCVNCSPLTIYLCALDPVPCKEFRTYTGDVK